MIRAFRAELRRLGRPRQIVIAAVAAAAYSIVVTWLLISTASPTPDGMISVPGLEQAGGATQSVITASTFSSVLVLALFVGMAAGDHSRGTWRGALLQNPDRLGLAAGTFLARLVVMLGIVVVLFVAGWAAAFGAAASESISTDTWLSAEAWRLAGEHLLKVWAYGTGWAVLGTAIGWLTRSVPIGLAIGVLWAGPIENALGDGLEFGQRWFPGLLLRHVVTGASSYSGLEIGLTLASYAAVVIGVTALVVQRRDVTS